MSAEVENKNDTAPPVENKKTTGVALKKNVTNFMSSFLNLRFFNLIILSVSFMIVFSGFNTSQNFMTSVHDDIGSVSLGIIYFFFSFSNLFAPTIVQIFGAEICVAIALIPYAIYVLVSAIPTPKPKKGFFVDVFTEFVSVFSCLELTGSDIPQCFFHGLLDIAVAYFGAVIIFLCSAVLGCAAALLWTSQGAYLTQIARNPTTKKSENGLFSGGFFAIFQLNLIIGNLLMVILLFFNINIYLIFLLMFFLTIIGNFLSFYLPVSIDHFLYLCKGKKKPVEQPIESSSEKPTENSGENAKKDGYGDKIEGYKMENEKGIKGFFLRVVRRVALKGLSVIAQTKGSLLNTFSVLFDKRMLLLAPLFTYSGFTNSYFYGTLPQLTRNKTWIALGYIFFGIAEFFGSIAFGKANDLLGKRIMIIVTLIVHAAAIISSLEPIFLLTGHATNAGLDEAGQAIIISEGIPLTIFLCYIMWGIADASMNTSIYSIIPAKSMFHDRSAFGFAAFKLCQSMAAAIMFIVGMFLKDIVLLFQLFLIILLLIATICIAILQIFFVRLDAKEDPKDSKSILKAKTAKFSSKKKEVSKEEVEPIIKQDSSSFDNVDEEKKIDQEAEIVIPTNKENDIEVEDDLNIEEKKFLE